jgi:hypothetical protein
MPNTQSFAVFETAMNERTNAPEVLRHAGNASGKYPKEITDTSVTYITLFNAVMI